MPADINLLPKKDPRNPAALSVYLIIAFIILIIISVFIIQSYSVNQNRKALQKEVTQLEAENAALSASAAAAAGSSKSSIAALQTAVEYSADISLDTVPILRELSRLLPERGFFKAYSYNDAGELTLTVQFDTNREAAYYLARLKDSIYFTEADLNSLSAVTEEVSPEISLQENNSPSEEEEALPRSEAHYLLKINPDYVNPSSEDEANDNPSS
jgi:type IV pilus assembly protein PilN